MLITETKANRAYLAKIVDDEVVFIYEFQFNPTEDEKQREVEFGWLGAQGSALPEAVFNKISKESFTIELLLDATENYSSDKEGVGADIAVLESFTFPDPDNFSVDLGQVAAPPLARFGIGNDAYPVVIESVRTRVSRRNKEMHPTRAYVELTMASTYQDLSQIRRSISRNAELAAKAIVR